MVKFINFQNLRKWLPGVVLLLIAIGFFTPLFDLHQIHGVASPLLYFQHFYFELIASVSGYWAASFCTHWYHRIPLFIIIDILSTFGLVTLIG